MTFMRYAATTLSTGAAPDVPAVFGNVEEDAACASARQLTRVPISVTGADFFTFSSSCCSFSSTSSSGVIPMNFVDNFLKMLTNPSHS